MNNMDQVFDSMVTALLLGDVPRALSIFAQAIGDAEITWEDVKELLPPFIEVSQDPSYLSDLTLWSRKMSAMIFRRQTWDALVQRWPEHQGQRPRFDDFDFDASSVFIAKEWCHQGHPKRFPEVLVQPAVFVTAFEVVVGFDRVSSSVPSYFFATGQSRSIGLADTEAGCADLIRQVQRDLPRVARVAWEEEWRTCAACGDLWNMEDSEACPCGAGT